MTSETSDASVPCPSCGKPVDPLRAGQVALVGGAFLYFCDLECKSAFVRARGASSDEATAAPPEVARRLPTEPAFPSPAPKARAASQPGESEVVAASETTTFGDASDDAPSDREAGAAEPSRVSEPASIEPMPREERHVASESRLDAAPSERAALRSSRTDDGATELAAAAATSTSIEAPTADPPDSPARADDAPAEPGPESREVAPPPSSVLAREGRKYLTLVEAGSVAGGLAWLLALAGDRALILRGALAALSVAAATALLVRSVRGGSRRLPRALGGGAPLLCAVSAWGVAFVEDPHRLSGVTSLVGVASAAVVVALEAVRRAREDAGLDREAVVEALRGSVRRVEEEREERMPPTEIKPGQEIACTEGEIIGVDGVIVAGEGVVRPWMDALEELKKTEGDAVAAGATVVSGSLRIRATWTGAERAWERAVTQERSILHLSAWWPIMVARFADWLQVLAIPAAGVSAYMHAGSLVDVVLSAAAAAASVSVLGMGATAAVAHLHAFAQRSAQTRGIIYRDADAFDQTAQTLVVAICARGVVLRGQPEIVVLDALGEMPRDDVLALAASAERASSHAIARAIVSAALAKSKSLPEVRHATSHDGLGVTGTTLRGERVAVGNRGLMLRERVSIASVEKSLANLEARGHSVVLIALDDKLVGLMALQDGLRAGARAAVQRLHRCRVEPVLLSGDARETCETIAKAVDIEHVRPEIVPSERGTEVRAMRETGHVTAVMGDPRTDDAALGAADVSIALLAAGAAPGEWTVSLATNDPRAAATAVALAKRTRERSRVAVGLSLAPPVLALVGIAVGAPVITMPLCAVLGAVIAIAFARAETSRASAARSSASRLTLG